MGGLPVLADRQTDLIDAVNRPIRRDMGQAGFGQQVLWTRFDGATPARNGAAAASGLYTHVIRNTGGNHLAILLAATSPTATPSATNAVLLVQDSGLTISELLVGGNIAWKSGTAFKITLDHAATADRTITVPDATDTLALLAATQTLSNKTLTATASVSFGATPATIGVLRLATGTVMASRNAANTANVIILQTDASDNVIFGDQTNSPSGRLAGATDVRLQIGATARATLTATELTLVNDLVVNGGRVKFPATQNASTDANTLDDYQEGAWVPSLGGTATYTGRDGWYVKIGRHVFFGGFLTVNLIGSGSTNTISGLPESGTDFNDTPAAATHWSSLAANPVFLSFRVSGATLVASGLTAAGASTSTLNIFGNGASVYFGGSYRTAS